MAKNASKGDARGGVKGTKIVTGSPGAHKSGLGMPKKTGTKKC